MLTPRDNFKTSDLAKGWQSLMDSNQFQAGASAAMLEMQFSMSHAPDLATAAAYNWQLAGARRFLETLMGLADAPAQAKSPVRQNLQHGL